MFLQLILLITIGNASAGPIDVMASEVQLLNLDLRNLTGKAQRLARIDSVLGKSFLYKESSESVVKDLIALRQASCDKAPGAGFCPPSSELLMGLCADATASRASTRIIWNGIFLPYKKSSASLQGVFKVLDQCGPKRKIGRLVGAFSLAELIQFNGSAADCIAGGKWLSQKVLPTMDAPSVQRSYDIVFSSEEEKGARSLRTGSGNFNYVPVGLLLCGFKDSSYENVILEQAWFEKVVAHLAKVNSEATSKIYEFLLSFGRLAEAQNYQATNAERLKGKWDIYYNCVRLQQMNDLDGAEKCLNNVAQDQWGGYLLTLISVQRGNRDAAMKSLARLKDWKSPYKLLLKLELNLPLSAVEVALAKKSVADEYEFGFIFVSSVLVKSKTEVLDPDEIKNIFLKSHGNRFLAKNFDNANVLNELAKALGPTHGISRAIAKRKF